jgi:hypothetical protein
MGFAPERPKVDPKPLHHVYLTKGKDKATRLEYVKKNEKVQSSGIE